MRKTDEYSFVLAPSKIAGVGVFATHLIKKGTKLALFPGQTRFIPKNSPELKDDRARSFCIWFCVETENGYECPRNFNRMDMGWHLNHSKRPNAAHVDYEYYALADIKKGEEIVIDYASLEESNQTLKPISVTN